jgi:hypothetical protein
MPNWRRSESRTVRPFPSADACLAGVRMKLFSDADFDERTSFDTSEVELRDVSPEFLLALDHSALKASPLAASSDLPFSLVIRLTDLRLHRSELVFESALPSLPRTWAVPPNVRNRFSWRFGVDASVALLLASDRPVKPGQPFMRGHWVARRDFSIRPKVEPRAFPIERWTADDFARQGLPRDSVYWIQFFADDLNDHFDDPREAFRVCLRQDVYDAFAYAEKTPQARALFSMILAEILAEVLWRGLRNLNAGEDIERGGLLHSAVVRVVKATNTTVETLRKFVEEGELSKLRTFAQATVGARQDVARAWVQAPV